MTRQRPPGEQQPERRPAAAARARSDSSLTAIRMAWKTRVAGWPRRRRAAAGTAACTTSASCAVVSIGRAATMAGRCRRASRPSPLAVNQPASSVSLGLVDELERARSTARVHAHVEGPVAGGRRTRARPGRAGASSPRDRGGPPSRDLAGRLPRPRLRRPHARGRRSGRGGGPTAVAERRQP